MRLAACMAIELHVIEPAGFRFDDAALRRAGMDYAQRATVVRHPDWHGFETWRVGADHRLVLFTTAAHTAYTDFAYRGDDILLFGSESGGVPDAVHRSSDACVRIPMVEGARSLNVALAAAIALGEALRQISLPETHRQDDADDNDSGDC